MRPPARTGSPPARSSILAAVAGGVLLAAAFPLGPPALPATTDGWWALGWVCLAPMMVAAARASSRRNAALAGLAAGLVAYGLVFAWILPFLSRWGMLSAPEAWGVFLPMILYLASYTSTFCLCVRTFAGRWGEPAAFLLAPAAWTALELIRAKILTGFPWCLLGYSQHGIPAAIQVADLAGVYGVSFQLASSAALLACIVTRPRTGGTARPSRRAAAAALGIVSALGPLYGAARLATMPAHSETIKAALVQANIPQSEKWDPREAARIELDHFAMTREAAAAGASLIVWSESAVPYSITHQPGYAGRLESLSTETGADLLAGTVAYEQSGSTRVPFNSAVLATPAGGLIGRYDKRQLVPFGEYVPLRRLLFFLESLVKEAGDFRAGTGAAPLRARGADIGTLICYEAIFPELARRSVREGAQLLVNITNDAWYGDTAMPRQHLAHAVLRAVESRRHLLRCANTGISAAVEPTGHVTARTHLGEKALLRARVASSSVRTLYTRAGDVFAMGCAILTAVALAMARRPRRTASEPGPR